MKSGMIFLAGTRGALHRLTIFISIVVTCATGLTAQQARIVLHTPSKRDFPIRTTVRNGIVCGAIDDIGKALGFRVHRVDAKRKIGFILPGGRLWFSADNPFVAVTRGNASSMTSLHQMPHRVITKSGTYYTPLQHLPSILAGVWNVPLIYDRKNTVLRVGVKGTKEPEAIAAPPRSASDTRESTRQFDITHCSVESRLNGTMIRIHSRRDIRQFESTLNSNQELTVTITGATADASEIEQTPSGGEIEDVHVGQRGSTVSLHFTLNADFESCNITKDAGSHDLIVALYRKANVDSIYTAELGARKKQDDQNRDRWKLDVVVIDAGHGGKDPGTIGVHGTKEKHVALGIALKLGRLIERNLKTVRVVYTRKNDRFVELYRRGQIANENTGKLFISIHANSTEKKPSNARGFEVYLLRPGRTDEAIRVAETENSVVKLEKDFATRYTELTNENFILVNMAQSAYMKYSERFAEILHEAATRSRSMKSNGVKQAGFFVLVGASMPGVLIETGYMSHTVEEKYLASAKGQQEIAQMIFKAVEKYSKEYDKTLK